jgi:Zn-dependent M28 family amino/carboxypeptidase
MGTRFALAGNHRSVAVRIRNRFAGLGYTDVSLDSFLVTKTYRNINYEQWQYNVITLIRGTKYPDSLCIIGAHYDNNLVTEDPFKAVPGANDNASGVAAMLEVARVMKKHGFSPKSSIMFAAFGAEEIGLFGSIHIVSTPSEFTGKIRFMLNNDMIAYEGMSDPYPSAWCVNIVDYDNSHNLRGDAEKICTKYTQLIYVNDNKYYKQSDSYPFYVAGYKALFFFSEQLDPNIHTLNDIAENYQFGYCSEIVKISCALLADKN